MKYKTLRLVTLFLATSTVQATNEFIAPSIVIADHQEFWGGLNMEKCKVENDCDIQWVDLPDDFNIQDGGLVLAAHGLKAGKYNLVANVKDKSGSVTSVEHQFVSQSVQSEVVLDGFPFDIENTVQRVWLDTSSKSKFKCIFYDGEPEIQTPPHVIEQNKLFCRVIWENIPPGFNRVYKTNPSILEGTLTDYDSQDFRDYTFVYKVESYIPYGTVIQLADSSVDATIDTFEIMELNINHPNSQQTYTITDKDTEILVDINVERAKGRAIKIEIFEDQGDLIASEVVLPGHNYVYFNIPEAIKNPIGQIVPYEVRVSYVDIPSIYKSETIKIVHIPPVSVQPDIKYSFDEQNEEFIIDVSMGDDTSDAVWSLELLDVTDEPINQFNPAYASGVDDLKSTFVTGGASKRYTLPVNSLLERQYIVSSRLVAFKDGDQGLYYADERYSKPFYIFGLRDGKNTLNKQVLLEVSEGTTLLTYLYPEIAAQAKGGGETYWQFGIEKNRTLYTQQIEIARNKRMAIVNTFHASSILSVTVTHEDADADISNEVHIKPYSKPLVGLTTPSEIVINSSKNEAVLTLNEEEISLSDYSAIWSVDGKTIGEATKIPLQFGRPGNHLITVVVRDRNIVGYVPFVEKVIQKNVEVIFNESE